MTAQPSLWDVPGLSQQNIDRGQRGRSRRSDPETSVQAAASIGTEAERAIKRLFAIPRALTDDELAALIPELHGPTIKSARSRLSAAGFLKDSGERRLSARKRSSIVWTRST